MSDEQYMRRALQLARQGAGAVEPNPLVGCVVVRDGKVVGEGYHRRFGAPHAEIEALEVAGEAARGATLYVTLEPCCHQGKTPPCTEAIQRAGIARAVVAQRDPFPQVDGGGLARLAELGIQVQLGLLEPAAHRLNAPYRKLILHGRPWVIAKWAMTWDGKLASRTGQSRWISNQRSRAWVHQLRGRVDAVLVGSGTAVADDPLLTARPPGPRQALRIVLDGSGRLPVTSRLVQTAHEQPVLIATGPDSTPAWRDQLTEAGCEVLCCVHSQPRPRLTYLLDELGRRRLTNLLVEGGGQVLGAFFDLCQVDQVELFLAPKLIGGAAAVVPLGGTGLRNMSQAARLQHVRVEQLEDDLHLSGDVVYAATESATDQPAADETEEST